MEHKKERDFSPSSKQVYYGNKSNDTKFIWTLLLFPQEFISHFDIPFIPYYYP